VKAKANLKNQLTKARLEALQSQMNPHFIFNALNSIQNYIIDHKIDDALMYMGNFSKLIRQTLDNSTHYYITISEVIEYLETYIQIENLRFDNTINLEIITSNINIATITIPPMLIQPLVENSILHGFKNREKEFKLSITFSKQDKYIKCMIKDNGAGFDINQKEENRAFHALEAIKERLLLLQEQKKEKLIHISSLPEGTTVTLLILYNTVS
jgi:LytS/YehU family sensor histidine kinase